MNININDLKFYNTDYMITEYGLKYVVDDILNNYKGIGIKFSYSANWNSTCNVLDTIYITSGEITISSNDEAIMYLTVTNINKLSLLKEMVNELSSFIDIRKRNIMIDKLLNR